MITSEETKYKKVLCVSAILMLIRVAIYHELVSLPYLVTLTKYVVVVALILVVSYYTFELFTIWRKLYRLPGPKLMHGLRIITAFYTSRRGFPVPVHMNEIYTSLSMLSLKEYNGHLLTVFSWIVPVVLVTSPQAIKEVINHPHSQHKGIPYFVLKLIAGDGLLTSSGERWKSHRRLLTPAFHFKILESLMSIVIPQADLLVSKLEKEASSKDDRSVDDIVPYVFDTMMNVLCQTSMGIDSANQSNVAAIKTGLTGAAEKMCAALGNPFLFLDCVLGVTRRGREFKHFRRAMDSFVDEVITKRMAQLKDKVSGDKSEIEISPKESKEREPFIDIMIREHLKRPELISLEDIRGETTTFTFVGLDTTLWSITYTLLLLGHHPQVQEKLYREVEEFFSERDFNQLTPERIKEFTYLNAVYNESLRFLSPVPFFTRTTTQDIVIAGHVIPKDTEIFVPIGNIHRDTRYWSDPHRFKPERFLTYTPEPYTFIPFSAGPRNCLGQKYANIQAKTAIVRIVSKYRIESVTQIDEVVTFASPIAHTQTPIKLRLNIRDENNNH